jgi:hypothetical protein
MAEAIVLFHLLKKMIFENKKAFVPKQLKAVTLNKGLR